MLSHNSAIDLVNEEQAAAILGLRPRTLTRWRWAGKGPRYGKVGSRVRYARADLQAFIDASFFDGVAQ